MTEVKLIVGANSIERITTKHKWYNPERYEAFVEVFGEGNFGLVASPGLEREIITGELCETVVLNKDLEILKTERSGIKSKLILASTFENPDETKVSRKNMERFMNYLEKQRIKGNIKHLVNSRKSSLYEDKLTCLDLKEKGVKTPPTYHFNTFKELKAHVETNSKNYIVKHRFGEAGSQVSKINSSNIDSVQNYNIEDYIVQEEIDLVSESRMIFVNKDFLGARIIHDRNRPWDKNKDIKRKHQVLPYKPSIQETKDSKRIMEITDTDLGCVDWAFTKNKERYFLELNGVGTGLGYTGGPYNFNKEAAKRLKEKYLK